MTGEIDSVKTIKKTSGRLEKILGAYVKQSAKLKKNNNMKQDDTFDAIHFVMASNQSVSELHIALTGGFSSRLLDYTKIGLPLSSELIGIASASSSVL